MADTNKNTETFEGALARLEEIVRMLESGNSPLDKSLAYFEEGTALVKQCNSQLDGAEQKIKILMQKQDGSYEAEDWQQN